jgi:hypothetical protein
MHCHGGFHGPLVPLGPTNADLIYIFGFASRLSPIAIAPLLGFAGTSIADFCLWFSTMVPP